MSEEDEIGGACIPPEHKERLLRTYESERNFYTIRLESLGDDADPEKREALESKIKEAEDNLENVKGLPVCDAEEDVDTPAELPETSDSSSAPLSRSQPPS